RLGIERVHVPLVYRRTRRGRGERRGLGIQLEPLGLPAGAAGRGDEAARVCADVEEPAPFARQAPRQGRENVGKDRVLVARLMLARAPVVRPALVGDALATTKERQ